MKTGTAVALGTLAGCALPEGAGSDLKILFPLASATIPVAGIDAQFPVRRIYCVGRNYAAHARNGLGPEP